MGVSYQPYRVVMEGSPARGIRTEPGDVRVVRNVLGTATSNPLTFDGVLPRWHGRGFRLEVDRISGRQSFTCAWLRRPTSHFARRRYETLRHWLETRPGVPACRPEPLGT